jgi:hypothetical protein
MLRTVALLAVLMLGSAATVEAAAVEPVLAQYSSQQDQRQEERSSRRSSRGMFKLAAFGIVAALGIGGWVIKKVRGQ